MVTLSTITYDQTQTLTTEQKFAWLYARERDVRAYLLSLVGAALAEDVLQTVWEKVWKALPRTEQVSYSWLRTIAAHAALDALRRQSALAAHMTERLLEECEDLVEGPTCEQPELAALEREAEQRLLQLVPDSNERLILMAATTGRTMSGIARDLAIPRTTVWNTLKRVKTRVGALEKGA